MGTILTIASQKGGVGKTTTAVNLAFSLALSGRRVLLLDLDPQGNGCSGVGVPQASDALGTEGGFLTLALRNKPLEPCIRATAFDNLLVLPSCRELSRLDRIQEIQDSGLERFRRQVRKTAVDYDFVLVDCPPSLGGLPTIALGVSDSVVIPVQCEYYAMEGLSQILPIIQKVQATTNPKLGIAGLLMTMFSPELDLSHDVVREITTYFDGVRPNSVFRTMIPRDVVLAEASSHGRPAFEYAPYSRGAWSYLELAKEILRHEWT